MTPKKLICCRYDDVCRSNACGGLMLLMHEGAEVAEGKALAQEWVIFEDDFGVGKEGG